jgi:hypothetical protein
MDVIEVINNFKKDVERYFKTRFTKNNCTPGVRKEPGKAMRYIGTCGTAALKTLWME